jgi:hypothetical protein
MHIIYSSIEDSEIVIVFEHNNADLKKLLRFYFSEQTSDSSAFLNAMCILKLCIQQ